MSSYKILFQGDSITDCSRSRDAGNDHAGYGYAQFTKGALGAACPGEYRFLNRGVSGNRIVDVYARIKADIINLEPDYMSLLIGINDIWHEIGHRNGVDPEKFEMIYDMLISEVKAALPDIKIMLLGAFVLEGRATCNTEEIPDRLERFKEGAALNAAAAKRIAEKHGLVYIPLQEAFDKACEKAEPDYWTYDGVHPTPMGHELIKNEWLKGFEMMK